MICPDHRWAKDDDMSDPIFGFHYHYCGACEPRRAWFMCNLGCDSALCYDDLGPVHRADRRTCREHRGTRIFGGKPRCPTCGERDESAVEFDGPAHEAPQMDKAEDVRLVSCVNCMRVYKVIRHVVVTHESIVLEE